MPEKPFQLCAEPGCLERTRARHCERHATNNTAARNLSERNKRKSQDKIWSLYNAVQWTKRFRVAFLGCNPICQRIEAGQQCGAAATICHHLVSPRQDPKLMYDWLNIKAVCASHHPNVEGEPAENMDKLDKIYTETRMPSWMKK